MGGLQNLSDMGRYENLPGDAPPAPLKGGHIDKYAVFNEEFEATWHEILVPLCIGLNLGRRLV